MEFSRIGICEDESLVRNGLRGALEKSYLNKKLKIVFSVSNGVELMKSEKLNEIDLLVLDLEMPKMDGFQVTERLRRDYPAIKILILTRHKDKEYVKKLLGMGADGYVLKGDPDDAVIGAIDDIIAGNIVVSPAFSPQTTNAFIQSWEVLDEYYELLTHREKEVLALVAAGKKTAEIKRTLDLSEHTVKHHRSNICTKLRTQNLNDLVRIAQRHHLIT